MDSNQVQQQILDHISATVKSAVKEVTDQLKLQKQIDSPPAEGGFYSAEQAALFLKIKLNTIYAKVEKGELPHYRSGKRKLLFSKQELENYVICRKGKTSKDISDDADNYLIKK